jgi:hypothetical protein
MKGCDDPAPGNCSFYSNCLEPIYQCGANGYPLGYGNYYCHQFTNLAPQFSEAGQAWDHVTRICLVNALAPYITSKYSKGTEITWFVDTSVTCDDILNIAFGSHPACYTQEPYLYLYDYKANLDINSFCFLPASDVLLVIEVSISYSSNN